MSTVEIDHERSDEKIIVTKGAPDLLLQLCSRARIGLDVVPLTEELRTQLLAEVDELADDALRGLSVAYRPLSWIEQAESEGLKRDLIFVGTVGMIDPPRPEAAAAIAVARRAGVRVLMITGDHPRTAIRIATDLGIVEPGDTALTGLELDELDPASFVEAVRQTSVYARVAVTRTGQLLISRVQPRPLLRSS
jgi:magnesium-transporting ATPase (P-type)